MYQEFLEAYKKELTNAVWGVDPQVFEQAVTILKEAWDHDKQVFIMGNGGSAGTANHFVCDFGKNAVQGAGRRRFRILSVSDNVEKITALGNDIAFEEVFRFQLENLLNPGDVLITVSASGNSPDLVRACQYAKETGARQITLSGFAGGKIKEYSDAAFVVPLESYERIEDLHLMILRMIVCYFKNNPQLFEHDPVRGV